MEAKLILKHRGDYDYFLLSRTENSEAVQASLIPDDEFEQKLSKENCDEMFGVVNVENLAENHPLEVSNASHGFGIKDGIVYGFNKAIELNKDKLFTLEDLKNAFYNGWNYRSDDYQYPKAIKEYLQHLQQQTEIEVEVEVFSPNDLKSVENDWSKLNTPKLDENGCLILKKI